MKLLNCGCEAQGNSPEESRERKSSRGETRRRAGRERVAEGRENQRIKGKKSGGESVGEQGAEETLGRGKAS